MAKKIESVESTVRNIRRKTRKKYSAEEKIRIVIEWLRAESTVAELSRREGLHKASTTNGAKNFWKLENSD
jgi:transposase